MIFVRSSVFELKFSVGYKISVLLLDTCLKMWDDIILILVLYSFHVLNPDLDPYDFIKE